ncbi:MAG: hypothetical protein HY321_09630 [Armatimonadetes bacterium]|nr:hypothetical protein [Armatimonadota bacterium]
MRPRARWWKAGIAGGILLALVTPLADSAECPVTDTLFPDRPADAWMLALRLGPVDGARDVYAPLPAGTRAHFYVLSLEKGQSVRVALSAMARQGSPPRLHLALAGPGLPAAKDLAWIRRRPGDGLVRAARVPSPAPGRPGPAAPDPYRLQEVLQVTALARGEHVLIVYREGGPETAYRLAIGGGCRYGPGAIVRQPLYWFRKEYLLQPQRAVSRLLAVLLGASALVGLWYLGWQRRITERGGFVR